MYGAYGSLVSPKLTRLFCHQAHSCPPREWSGAGVGLGMLRGKGFLGLGFLVSWFLGFLVFGLLVS